jgi:hypothetical protein
MNITEHINHDACDVLLLDLICYELSCGRLSPEMKYLLERHMEQCPNCRSRIYGFLNLLEEDKVVRNFG